MSQARLGWGCALLGTALLFANGIAHAAALQGRAHAIDGDSLRLGDEEIRLQGIDAPEARQACTRDGHDWACGRVAAQALAELVEGGELRCTYDDRDAYGRALATCTRDGRDVNAAMVERGLALAYRHYTERYAAEEDRARQARRGLWAGEFEAPWRWRHARHGDAAAGAAASCRIKGNVSRSGARIYHVPGSRDYDAVRIDPARGERCFDSVEEARGAGFRAPRR
ncbi:MAG: thermonuclease family protein [Gammaproteobacteria bacterium]|nr:thermonuclease family protein [Gammaproteobacteria bacterium]